MIINDILARLPSVRVLVVGDVMVDHYIWGDVTRISPEAPVPVVHVSRETETSGGAANVSLNLAALGTKSAIFGCVGDDLPGRSMISRLTDASIGVEGMIVSTGIPTIVKTRVIARMQQICRIDHESPRKAYCIHENEEWMRRLEAAVAQADAVIISDYAKGVITQEVVDFIVRRGRLRKILVAIDPKPARCLQLRGIGLIKPNRGEALELAGIGDWSPGEPYPLDLIAQRIHERFAPELLVITLGADGMAICRNGIVEHTMPTAAREIFDVSGAGDTAIAALVAGLAVGADPISATRFANIAAGLVVAKVGTAVAKAEEVLDAVGKVV